MVMPNTNGSIELTNAAGLKEGRKLTTVPLPPAKPTATWINPPPPNRGCSWTPPAQPLSPLRRRVTRDPFLPGLLPKRRKKGDIY